MAFRSILTKLVQHTKSSVVRQFVGSTVRVERCRLPVVKPFASSFSGLSKPTRWGLVSRLAGQYYTETFAAELRRRAAFRFLLVGPWGGRQGTTRMANIPGFARNSYLPTFALIGFSFLTRHPYADSPAELDGIISDIKETLKDTDGVTSEDDHIQIPKSWDDVQPVSFLAKGCCGAVFTAKCRTLSTAGGPCEHIDDDTSTNMEYVSDMSSAFTDSSLYNSEESLSISLGSEVGSYYEDDFSILSETEDIVQVYPSEVNTWEFVESDALVDFKQNTQSEGSAEWSDDDISVISESEFENSYDAEMPFRFCGPFKTRASVSKTAVKMSQNGTMQWSDISILDSNAENSEVPVVEDSVFSENYEASSEDANSEQNKDNADSLQVPQPPEVVVKYLFNYNVESNYSKILKMFWSEALPTKFVGGQEQLYGWLTDDVKKKLPPHHNIVKMYNVFPGAIPDLDEAVQHFECALPRNQYPESYGRNMTLCLVMKRYEMTLKDYLSKSNPSMKVRTMLFAQLLEGILHLSSHGVAHRDLKSNNILLEGVPATDNSEEICPHLVITDFGCCLEDTNQQIPYQIDGYGKEGNVEHRAPEISDIRPGKDQFLDYSKADLWAVGVLAFEIFGISDHFNWKTRRITPLPDTVPDVIKNLIHGLLVEDPAKRLDARTATNILHIYLWGWSEKVNNKLKPFLLNLINEVCDGLKENKMSTECCLKKTFLERLNTEDLFDAVLFVCPQHSFAVDLRKVIYQFPNIHCFLLDSE